MALQLIAQLVSAEEGRGKGQPLVTATLDFDDDYARVYAERLAEGREKAEQWLAEHAEQAILRKCKVVYRLSHDSE